MTWSLDGRRFTADSAVWSFREDREGVLTGTYEGGRVRSGSVVGRRDGRDVSYAWSQLGHNGATTSGTGESRLQRGDRGLLELPWAPLVLSEVPGPRWVRARVAHPSRSLSAAIAFYGDLLELPYDGPHVATPYDLVFFALPGGSQLELTAGGPEPVPGTADDLLVLYVPTPDDVGALRSRVTAAGAGLVPALNPYWERTGFTVRDPDGRLVVVAHLPA